MSGGPVCGVFQIQRYAVWHVVALCYLGLVILAADAEHLGIAGALICARSLKLILSVHHPGCYMTEYAFGLRGLAARFGLHVALAAVVRRYLYLVRLVAVIVTYVSIKVMDVLEGGAAMLAFF